MKSVLHFTKGIILKPLMVLSALIITSIVIVSCFLVLPLWWIPLLLYRGLIICIAKYKIPDGRVLTKQDCILSIGEEYTSTYAYITVQIVLEGKLSPERAINECTEFIKKGGADGQLKFPELQDYFENFGGYIFRRKIQNFEAKNYIHVHQDDSKGNEAIDKLKILEIRKKFLNTLFRPKSPLWEVLIVNNYRDQNCESDSERSVLILKFHHALGDGAAIVNLLFKHVAGCTTKDPNVFEASQKLKFLMFLQKLNTPFLLMKHMYRNVFDSLYNPSRIYDINPWHMPQSGLKPVKRNHILWVSEPIKKQIFREIKSVMNVSIMSILLTVISGGMRRMMIAKGLSIPKKIRITFPVPKPDHPDKITNHASIAIFRIPFSKIDFKETIMSIERLIKKAVPGPAQLLTSFNIFFSEVIPVKLKKLTVYSPFETINVASMRSHNELIKIGGLKAVATNYALSFNRTNAPCLMSIMGFGDEFHMTIQLENSILTHPDEVQDLEKYILEELDFIATNCLI